MFFVGVLSLLLIVPIGQHAVDATGASVDWATALGSLMVQSNEYAYQISQIALTFGALSLWFYGYRARLIPRAFAAWGLIGYVIHMAGCIAELFGVHIGMMTMIPGALFEITLPFWLFFKGFNAEAYGKTPSTPITGGSFASRRPSPHNLRTRGPMAAVAQRRQKMKAMQFTRTYGAPSVVTIADVPKPTPKDNEVLIRIHATTVTTGDWRARSLDMPAGFASLRTAGLRVLRAAPADPRHRAGRRHRSRRQDGDAVQGRATP